MHNAMVILTLKLHNDGVYVTKAPEKSKQIIELGLPVSPPQRPLLRSSEQT